MAAAASNGSPKPFLMFPKSVCSFDGMTFAVDPRYQIRCRVGQGAQGVICSALDEASADGREVAIKKMPNALEEVMASKRLLRELRLLRHLKHEHIVSLLDIMLPPSTNVLMWKDVYVVSELMDTDLDYVITSGQEITDDHVQVAAPWRGRAHTFRRPPCIRQLLPPRLACLVCVFAGASPPVRPPRASRCAVALLSRG